MLICDPGDRGWNQGAEPGAEHTTDLSLATPLAILLKTAVFVPFFLRNAFIKTRNLCIFFASTSHETFQTRASALPQHQARVKWASAEQWYAVRLYISKTNFSVLSAITVLTAHALIASLRWLRELNALQLQKTHANKKSTSKLRKHLHRFDSTHAANPHSTCKSRNTLQII